MINMRNEENYRVSGNQKFLLSRQTEHSITSGRERVKTQLLKTEPSLFTTTPINALHNDAITHSAECGACVGSSRLEQTT